MVWPDADFFQSTVTFLWYNYNVYCGVTFLLCSQLFFNAATDTDIIFIRWIELYFRSNLSGSNLQ